MAAPAPTQSEAPPAAAAPVAPAAAPEAAPAAAAPAAPEAAPAASTPAGDPPPAATEAAPKAPGETTAEPAAEPAKSLLETAKAIEGDAKPDAPLATEQQPPAEAAPPAAVEYKYELGEHLVMPEEMRTELHTLLDTFRADPTNLQPLVDFHQARLLDIATQARENQFKVFNEMREGWRTDVMADPELGGSRHATAMSAVARVRDDYVSLHPRGTPQYEADHRAFTDMLNFSGVGDNPAMLRFLHNVYQGTREARAPIDPNPKLPPQRPAGGSPLHDNPRSPQSNGRA